MDRLRCNQRSESDAPTLWNGAFSCRLFAGNWRPRRLCKGLGYGLAELQTQHL